MLVSFWWQTNTAHPFEKLATLSAEKHLDVSLSGFANWWGKKNQPQNLQPKPNEKGKPSQYCYLDEKGNHHKVTRTNVVLAIIPQSAYVVMATNCSQLQLVLLQKTTQNSSIGFFLVVSVDLLLLFALDDSCVTGSNILRDWKQSLFVTTSSIRHMHNKSCYQIKFEKISVV